MLHRFLRAMVRPDWHLLGATVVVNESYLPLSRGSLRAAQ
jgi:hypothetical protein